MLLPLTISVVFKLQYPIIVNTFVLQDLYSIMFVYIINILFGHIKAHWSVLI